jgi:hypothetical protein
MNKNSLLKAIDIIIGEMNSECYLKSLDDLRKFKQQLVMEYPDDPEIIRCEVSGCSEEAEYQGYWRVKDSFNIPTGLIQLRNVCNGHKSLLIGSEK